ncbi:MAG: hypothetical protein KIS78_07885 [Labilithrix sp.]|nr:hypothetical protein [Labilithrix sp.]
MSEAERERRNQVAREAWASERLKQLRASLESVRGKTVVIEPNDPTHQIAPRLLVRVVAVRGDEVEVVDMSDAKVPPSEKPRLTIGLGQIRDWRQA